MDPNNPLYALRKAETIEAYEPTLRSRMSGGLYDLLRSAGLATPRHTTDVLMGGPGSLGIGLVDLTPLGMIFGAQEGYRSAAAGVRTEDPGLVAMGTGEALLSLSPLVGKAADPLLGMVARGSRRAPGASEAERLVTRLSNQLDAARKRAQQARASASEPGLSRIDVIRRTAEARELEAEVLELQKQLQAAQAAPPEATEAARLASAETTGRVTQARRTRRDQAAADAARAAGWDRGEFRTVRHQVGWEGVKPTAPTRTGEYNPRTGRARVVTEGAGQAAGRKAVFKDFLEVPVSTAQRLGLERFHFRDPDSRISPDGNVFYLAPQDRDGFLTAWETQASRPGGVGPLPSSPTVKPPVLDTNVGLDAYEALFQPRPGVTPRTWQQIRQDAASATRRKPEGEK